MIDLEEQVQNGEAIARFLGDTTVMRILSGMELDYFEEWKTEIDEEKQKDLRATARALDDLVKALRVVVDSGKSAMHQIEQRSKPQIG